MEKMQATPECNGTIDCYTSILPIKDALDTLNGKWKLPILFSLTYGNKRFTDIERSIKGLSAKMLSKNLKEMEMNTIITRTVDPYDNSIVEYTLSEYGMTLEKILEQLYLWGIEHRRRIMHSGLKTLTRPRL